MLLMLLLPVLLRLLHWHHPNVIVVTDCRVLRHTMMRRKGNADWELLVRGRKVTHTVVR